MNTGALSDLKVLELGEFFSAPLCAKLLADLGADVIKVELPPSGDPTRLAEPFRNAPQTLHTSGVFLYLNTNKRGVTLDPATDHGRAALSKLAGWADVIVENWCQHHKSLIDHEALRQANPSVVIASLSYFGLEGPRSHIPGSAFTAYHSSGVGYNTPPAVNDPAQLPPLYGPDHQGELLAGITAAINVLMVVTSRSLEACHREYVHLDVSTEEALVHNMNGPLGQFSYDRHPLSRDFNKSSDFGVSFGGTQPCADGYVVLHVGDNRMWQQLAKVVGEESWLTDPIYATRMSRAQVWDLIEARLQEWTRAHTKQEVFELCQTHGVPCAPAYTIPEVRKTLQFQTRGLFTPVSDLENGDYSLVLAPYHMSKTPARLVRPAPAIGEHTEDVLAMLDL